MRMVRAHGCDVRRKASIHIGTSGWSYPHWRGPFYPPGLPTGAWLGYYARRFNSVEVNNSFYRLPTVDTLRDWHAQVPASFLFAVKANRTITHLKKLLNPGKTIPPFIRRVETLNDQLGPLLFQLPPRWRRNSERLDRFLRILGRRHRIAIEFRDPSWFDDDIFALLQRHKAALCVYDLDRRQSPQVVTADFVYLRLHGPDGPYRGRYRRRALEHWADAITGWQAKGKDVYCYFDNDDRGYAARNAAELQRMVTR